VTNENKVQPRLAPCWLFCARGFNPAQLPAAPLHLPGEAAGGSAPRAACARSLQEPAGTRETKGFGEKTARKRPPGYARPEASGQHARPWRR